MNISKTISFITVVFLVHLGFSQNLSDSNKCITGDDQNEKDFELDISLEQLNSGFIGAEGVLTFDILYGVGFYKQAVNLAISPFKNSMIFETRQNLFVGFFSFGFILGTAYSYANLETIYYVKPNVFLDIRFVKITYSYSFVNDKTIDFFNYGHNVGLRIPVFSTCGFSKFKGESKRWHWGHAHHGLEW